MLPLFSNEGPTLLFVSAGVAVCNTGSFSSSWRRVSLQQQHLRLPGVSSLSCLFCALPLLPWLPVPQVASRENHLPECGLFEQRQKGLLHGAPGKSPQEIVQGRASKVFSKQNGRGFASQPTGRPSARRPLGLGGPWSGGPLGPWGAPKTQAAAPSRHSYCCCYIRQQQQLQSATRATQIRSVQPASSVIPGVLLAA